MPLTDKQREELRQTLIREQENKAEQGLEMILDGSYKAELHLLNALNIVKDETDRARLTYTLEHVKESRLAMWAALGTLHREH